MSSGKLNLAPVAAVGAGYVIAAAAALREQPSSLVAFLLMNVLLFALVRVGWRLFQKYRTKFNERGQENQEAHEVPAKTKRLQTARQSNQRLIEEVGVENAKVVESAKDAVKRVVASESARAGWLGDVDFTADIAGITDSFRRAHELRKVAQQLATLAKPSANDREILADARRVAADLAATAVGRVELIQKCAKEAELVDRSLRQEREDARTAEQRAELHAKLGSMLYGIEATPSANSGDSAADAVIARVQAYREVKNQI